MPFSIWKRDVTHLAYGKREMPVFGLLHGYVVSGTVVRIVNVLQNFE